MIQKFTLLTVAAVFCLAGTVSAAGQHARDNHQTAGQNKVILAWDEFVKITGYDPAKKGPQILTIPWSDVEGLLGVELKGKVGLDKTTVDLPWKDFKALLEWSVRRKAGAPDVPPPADFIVTSSQYAGSLSADGANFTLAVKLNVLRKKGWKRIPLLPTSVALTRTDLPEGTYLNARGSAYELLTEKSGDISVTIDFSVSVDKRAGIYSVGFPRVMASSSILDLAIGGDGVDVKVAGSQSLTIIPPDKAPDKKTHVAAAIPTGQPVNITWERAVPKIPAAPTKLYAETRTLVAVADGILICREIVDFNILHTAVRQLDLTVPEGVSVLDVSGRNVQDWRVEKDGRLLVVLRGEMIGPYTLRISYETPATDTVEIPILRARNTEREKGFVGVIALANVEIGPGSVEGAAKIDVRQLPAEIAAMTNQPILLGFRYVAEQFNIPLTIKKHGEISVLVTIADSALLTTMQLNDGRRMTRAIYTVRNNRNQFLRVTMPPGADIWSVAVGGNMVSPATDEKGRVLIPLIRSAGTAELASFPVELVYVEAPETAAAQSGTLRVELPRLQSPTMHVMVNYYAPAEGTYGKRGGLFAAAQGGFAGTLRLVQDFAAMTTDAAAKVVMRDAQGQARAMQQHFEAKMASEAKAAGVTPIRVRLPIDGRLFKLEKILALPGDRLYFEVQYSKWKTAG